MMKRLSSFVVSSIRSCFSSQNQSTTVSHSEFKFSKVESQEIPEITGTFGLGVQNEAEQRLTEICQENALVIANTLFQQHKRRFYTWTSPDGQYQNRLAATDGEALYIQKKQDKELTVAWIMSSLFPNSDLN